MLAMRAAAFVVLEDDFLIAEDRRSTCEDLGARVNDVLSRTEGAAEGIVELLSDCAVVDVRLGGKRDGVEMTPKVHEDAPGIELVRVTGSTDHRQSC